MSVNFDLASLVYIGRKHSMLWLSGFGYIIIGISWIITGYMSTPDPSFDWLREWLGPFGEPEILGWLWVIAGVFQTLPAMLPRTKEGNVDRPLAFGFGLAIAVPVLWAAIYMVSALFGNIYGPRHGVVFAFMAITAWEISGWEEPATLVRVSRIVDAIKEENDAD